MDFNVKKLVRDAGTAFSRVVQLTEEKLGTAEKTELDSRFESLCERSDCAKIWTEKIVRDTEAVLTPNPGNRVEDFIFEKIEKKRPNRLSNLEYLGLDMIEAGNEFGGSSAYGSALIKVGLSQQRLGQCERDFIGSAGLCFTQPLRKFLDGEMKTIGRERGILESKRLDLDACKNRVRKARTMLDQQSAERDLRIAQSEFDRQAEITKLLLEGVSSSQAGHLRCLQDLVETQMRHYEQCYTIMEELKTELDSVQKPSPRLRINSEDIDLSAPPILETTPSPNPGSLFSGVALSDDRANISTLFGTPKPNSSIPENTGISGDRANMNTNIKGVRARVLCDYDAKDHSELSLMADEVIHVTECVPQDSDYMIGHRALRSGKVPRAFLEVLGS